MSSYKYVLIAWLSAITLCVSAQTNGSNSPYSQFGLGNLNEQSQGFNKAMSGLSMGFRDGNRINMQNPASYSAIDSLSFIFDVGMTLQNANFKNGSNSINAHNTALDYVNAAFRLRPGLGLSLGFVPFSTIGYNYSDSKYIQNNIQSGTSMRYTTTHNGNGGLHHIYMGLGWNPFGDLSVGVNVGYLWGTYSESIGQTFYEGSTENTSSNGLKRNIEADLSSYKIDFGVQYPIKIGNNVLTPGVTYGIGHAINSTAHCYEYQTNADTTATHISKAFDLPASIGAGLTWAHNKQWTVGVDVIHQMWSQCNVPQIVDNKFVSVANYQDRTKIIIGGEYQPDRQSRRYLRRVQYRLGASYTTPYYKINGHNGPKEFGLSAGFGLPITNNINNRSVINVSFQWVQASTSLSTMITENYLRLNIGITFNERWFMKWKIQ